MLSLGNCLDGHSLYCLLITTVTAVILQAPGASSIVAPSSNCYALDNSSHIFDFSSWLGQPFEYDGKDSDLVVRFCKDVESRSQTKTRLVCCLRLLTNKLSVRLSGLPNQLGGYVDFGRFDKFNYFVAGSGHINFVQEFYNGDLLNCERTHDKMGRTAQVNIICGSCSNGQCTGELGCICNVTYESTCRVLVELAIPCKEHGVHVFEGFTVGFHPRSWEIVYNGMTQLGFDKSHHAFSFGTEQTYVALYMTAIASLSTLVQKPTVKIFPEHGLKVGLSGSGATGRPPTTLSPTMLVVDWSCEKARDTPYEVDITIPVEGYEPIQFTLTKMCEYPQGKGGGTTRGWAIFGVASCIFIVLSTLFCCGGFVYKTRVERQRGLDALPGMTILSACLEAVSGGSHYSRAEDTNSAFINQSSWERQPDAAQGTWKTSERKYGSI